jgi:glyoxylase-like metal-dependent hydrolase (beta-lactamase superfamily II)
MTAFICVTCATQFEPGAGPPARCPVCLDERQYVGEAGQRWVTPAELGQSHRNRVESVEPGLWGIGVEPRFGIGQRALLVERLLWDCVPLLDPDTVQWIEREGGVDTIAISHPHFYSAMVQWAERLDARVLLHSADRSWIMRSSPRIELWSGDQLALSESLTRVRLGGHFPGGTVCLWADGADRRGALLSGDIVQVVEDRDWVSFMWSYPNLIPLPAREVQRMRGVLAGLRFDRVHGAWWGKTVAEDAHAKVQRSAERYLRALT